jgi:hypothetical protein
VVISPKIQIAEDSQPVGPMKSKTEADCISAGGAHAMSYFTKKRRRTTASHLLQRDKSNQDAIFKLFKHLQLIPALHSTGNNEF